MEQIIISLMFLYPGALVDVISKAMFRYSYCEDNTSESAHFARYFVSSTMITIASIMIYAGLSGRSVATLADIVKSLSGLIELAKYTVLSLMVTLVYTVVWHYGEQAVKWMINAIRVKREGWMTVDSVDAWHEMIYGEIKKEINHDQAIVRITNAEQSRIGFVKYWPDHFEDGIILTQCEAAAAFFDYDKMQENEEDKYIGSPWYTMYEPKSGTYIELYRGDKLSSYIDDQSKSVICQCQASEGEQ